MKEKIKTIYLVLGITLLILAIIAMTIWILKQVEIDWEALTFDEIACKKSLIKRNFDSNIYLKDLYGGGGLYQEFKYGIVIEIISVLTNKSEEDIKNVIKDEYFRLTNQAGWEQMNPLKIRDITGDIINWESLNYKEFSNEYCKRPVFIKFKQ